MDSPSTKMAEVESPLQYWISPQGLIVQKTNNKVISMQKIFSLFTEKKLIPWKACAKDDAECWQNTAEQ